MALPLFTGTRALFLEGRLEVLSTVEDAKNGHYIASDLKGDGDAPSKAEDPKSGTDVILQRTPDREGLQTLALLQDGVGVVGCDFGRSGRGDMEVKSNELGFSFRSVNYRVHYPAL